MTSEKPRIAYLVHSAAPSGAELALLRAAKHWPDRSRLAVYFAERGPLVAEFEDLDSVDTVVLAFAGDGIRAHRGSGPVRLLLALLGLISYARRVRHRLKADRPDVVVAGSIKSAIYGRVATIGLDIRFVWSVHDVISRTYLGAPALVIARLLPLVVDGIIVNSNTTLASIRTTGRPTLVCPPGAILRDTPRVPRRIVSDIAVLGRIAPWKGQDVALRAFAAAHMSATSRLHVIGAPLFGEDVFDGELRALAGQLGIGERTVFHGHVDDPGSLLSKMDVLMHTSVIPEPFGSVVIEGMNNSCVVIATKPGGPSEVISDGSDGFLVPCGDVESLRASLEHVVHLGADERSVIVRRAHATCERFGIASTTRAREGFIRSIAKGKPLAKTTIWVDWNVNAD